MRPTDTIKVVKRIGKKTDDKAIMLEVRKIKAFKPETKYGRTTLVYFTEDGEYIDEIRTEQTMKLFEELDGFVKTSRGNMVQISEIQHIDENNFKIYVDKVKSVFVDVSALHLKIIKKLLNIK
ncbi:LytTR family transcriptional regulator DNA-binding domain-containing protein [Paenibacillus polymyxa]|uniref:LytTR family transcriptional regulator DNA-binding domain-containing protein n=1 Tax=Paenibacillus polymyxa TaxID=1406 RepID=UPI00287F87BC|nr:LytTR family transcriptional regulator DNA-binding domain-containing protein [Paenibacillus polymyxa]